MNILGHVPKLRVRGLPLIRFSPLSCTSVSHQSTTSNISTPPSDALTSSLPPSRHYGFFYTYGTPLTSFFLWSSLTLMSLQYLWLKLDYEEYRARIEAETEAIKKRINKLNAQSEGKLDDGRLGSSGIDSNDAKKHWSWFGWLPNR